MNLLSLDAGRVFVRGNPLSLRLQAGGASAGRGAAPKSNCPIKIKLGPGQKCGSEQGISQEITPVQCQV